MSRSEGWCILEHRVIAKDAKCHPRGFGDRESPWFASRVVAAHLGLKSPTLGQQMKQRRTSEEAERTVGERRWVNSDSGSGDGLRDVGVRNTRLLMRAGNDKREFQVSGRSQRQAFLPNRLSSHLLTLESFPPRMGQFWGLWRASAGLEVPSCTPKIRTPPSSTCPRSTWT